MARRTRYQACLSRAMKGVKGKPKSRLKNAHKQCRRFKKK